MPAKPARVGKWEPRFHPGVFGGMLNSSSEVVVVTDQGLAIKTRSGNIMRIPESEKWDADRILGMRAWSPDGSDNAFDIQVGLERNGGTHGDITLGPRRGADGEQRSEDLPPQSRLRTLGSLDAGT